MSPVGFVVRHALQSRARAVFTLGSVVVAFLLFGLLMPLDRLLQSRVEMANVNRLITTNKTSMMRPLPVNYGERIGRVPGVTGVSHFTFFGAFYREPGNPVAALATDPARFPGMVEEVRFRDAGDLQRWIDDPSSVAIGRQLAQRMGWKVGDLVPIYSNIYPRADGKPVWLFRVAAIFDAAGANGNTDSMVLHYSLLDQARAFGSGTVGWYALRVAPERAGAVAQAVDALFAGSHDETSTVTEKAFAQSFLRQVGDFGAMIRVALVLVFWTLLLITGNTMAQAVRERFYDIAVLKALGFSEERVIGLVVLESLFIVGAGGIAGMALASAAIPIVASNTSQMLSALQGSWRDWAQALALMLGVALAIAALPALWVARRRLSAGLSEAMA
ncbi:MAG: FtsX-like permease family protein [Pseudomonadota bacterium]